MISLVRAAVGVCAALMLGALPVRAQQGSESLIGLWAYQAEPEPALQGTIGVSRQGHLWRAEVAGRRASAQGSGQDLRFVFPMGQGQFRGRLADHGRELAGFWVQPAGLSNGARQAYATPLTLRATGQGHWRGEVRPLPNDFTLYLKVFRDSDGALVAAFRNPQANSIGGRTQFLVSREGDAVRFASRPAPGREAASLGATLVGGRLHMAWPGFGREIDLTRRTPAQAADFFPRPPGSPPYVYRTPPQLNDGWRTAPAAAVGLDPAALTRIVQTQADSDPTALRPSLIHSILIARHGKLALEEYFFGFDRDTPHDSRSAAKTFSSVMLGSAMMRDPAFGPDSHIYELMAARGPFANPDPRKAQITLGQLMTHTSGLACDDNDDASPGNEETMQRQTQQPDWWKYTLDLPMAHDPGARYAYCSANINLVGAALTTRTHTWLPELFDRSVAEPLQFGRYYWNLTPTGEGYAGGGAYLTSRDFLKVGQAFLDGGTWRGRRIVPADWVKLSTAPHADINPATTGLTPDQFANAYAVAQDGYAWHLAQLKVGDRVYREYQAGGNGGQILAVVPEADLVVVFTGGNYGQGGIWLRWVDQIVAGQILPTIR